MVDKMEDGGWFIGYITGIDENVVKEIIPIDGGYSYSDLYDYFDSLDEAIEYYEMLLYDLKRQKINGIKIMFSKGRLLVKR